MRQKISNFGVMKIDRTPEHQNTRTPEHQNTRTPEHQNTRIPEQRTPILVA